MVLLVVIHEKGMTLGETPQLPPVVGVVMDESGLQSHHLHQTSSVYKKCKMEVRIRGSARTLSDPVSWTDFPQEVPMTLREVAGVG